MKNFIGKRVLILGNHPWSGEIGNVVDFTTTSFGQAGYLVELENGTSCFVFNENEMQILRT